MKTIISWIVGLSFAGLICIGFVMGIIREHQTAVDRRDNTTYGIDCHRISENEFVLDPWKEFHGLREDRYIDDMGELEAALNAQLQLSKKIVWNDRYKGARGVRVLTTDK